MTILNKLSESFTFERIIVLTLGGTLVHWYDFYIISFLLVEILGKIVDPSSKDFNSYLLIFSYLGFAIRPLGALLFSRYIDLYGRKVTFSWSLTLIAFSTISCALLPLMNLNVILVLALLILIRVVQGISLSVEYASALTYVSESTPSQNRGFYSGLVQSTAPLGYALALLIFYSTKLLFGLNFMDSFGWRITVLLGLPLIYLTKKIRHTLPESPVFEALKKTQALSTNPLKEVFNNPQIIKNLLFSLFAISIPQAITFYLAHIYLSNYVIQKSLLMNKDDIQLLLLLSLLLTWPITVMSGHSSDRFSFKKIFTVTMSAAAVVILSVFYLLHHNLINMNAFNIFWIFTLVFTCSHAIYGASGNYLFSKFPANVRATCISLPYHLANGLFGGGVFLINFCYPAKIYSTIPVVIYFGIFILLGLFLVIFFEKETVEKYP